MSQKLIECPRDPDKKYLKEVCATIFRKNNYRPWCRKCHYFQKTDSMHHAAK